MLMLRLPSKAFACCCVALATAAVPRPRIAQRAPVGPVAGEWAAEAGFGGSIGGASLMHFSTAQRAWLFGLTGAMEHASQQLVVGSPVFTASTESVDAQLGLRRYHAAGEALRPYWGLGLIGGIRHSNDAHAWNGGGYGEFGAAYFLAPHFSLGADGRLQAEYQRESGADTGHQWLAQFGLVRLTAAVYF
jgi:hypothetical protein